MSDDIVNIEVDGKPVTARKGQMLIQATDAVGAYIPRFCYHEKLTVAANCRMCLVQVEKAPKPLPACATPVSEGMKVFTKSPYAIAAQKATMEFLLINHPLDCPICDQGGECELQDIAMGYGRGVSRYNDRKRVVKDKDIGPLISTDMTRCIHCTRCVRFGEEITGMPQLGTIERGENMKIGTFIEQSVDHELSANIIDLCPVGALNNKPYRYSARAWEMVQLPTISPHDCVGSNLNAHVLRGRIKRIVPNTNEAINETWISDRDRFSFEGIYSNDRLQKPRLKENGEWRDISWDEGLQKLAEALTDAGPERAGILATPSVTTEEAHLIGRIAETLGTPHVDHRLRRLDFSDQDLDPAWPGLGFNIADIENADAILVVGSNLRSEAPIIAHRVRKAALKGAKVSFANRDRYDYFFKTAAYTSGSDLVKLLAGIAVAAAKGNLPKSVKELCAGIKADDQQAAIAASLAAAGNSVLITGNLAERHPASAAIRALTDAIAELTGTKCGVVTEGANSAGAHIAGLLPQRERAGRKRSQVGMNWRQMLEADMHAVVLVGVEPDRDLAENAVAQLSQQKFVAALTPYRTPALEECADLLLPMGTFAETSGTYVNCEGTWQSFPGIAHPIGEARPGWKVLRVLANLLNVPDSDYLSSLQIRDELQKTVGMVENGNAAPAGRTYNGDIGKPAKSGDADDLADIPMYAVDSVVRRSRALQLTPEALRRRGEQG